MTKRIYNQPEVILRKSQHCLLSAQVEEEVALPIPEYRSRPLTRAQPRTYNYRRGVSTNVPW
jgi:hypothetical protein